MDQLVVTVNDSRLLLILEKALDDTLFDIPSVVRDLIGVASGFTEEEIEEDARLSYLLKK